MAHFILMVCFFIFISTNVLKCAQDQNDEGIQGLDQISPHTPLTKARKILGLDEDGSESESEKKEKTSSSPSSGKYLTPPASPPLLSLKKPSPTPSTLLAPTKK